MRKLLWPALCFFLLLSLISCASRSAALSARSYVSSHTTWTYESTSGTGQAILKLSDGPQLVLPADHHFKKEFETDKTGTFLYCDECSSQSGEVATYLAPNNASVKKVLAARSDGGPGL